MKLKIAVLPGDGIGPEIVAEAVKTLHAVEKKFGHDFEMREALIGGAALDAVDDPLPAATVAAGSWPVPDRTAASTVPGQRMR